MATTLVEIAGMSKIALYLMASQFEDERGGEIHRRRRRERRGLESEISDLESSLRPLCALCACGGEDQLARSLRSSRKIGTIRDSGSTNKICCHGRLTPSIIDEKVLFRWMRQKRRDS
jgi:hypothetical protein